MNEFSQNEPSDSETVSYFVENSERAETETLGVRALMVEEGLCRDQAYKGKQGTWLVKS